MVASRESASLRLLGPWKIPDPAHDYVEAGNYLDSFRPT